MRIVIASPEAVPFSKTGGLADVVTALAKALADRGHDVWLIVPNHRRSAAARDAVPPAHSTGQTVSVPIAAKTVSGSILQNELPGSSGTCLLIDHPGYFDRDGLYQERTTGADYLDNCERFVFFSRAVMETVRKLQINPDVVHANDWQTALIPALLEVEYGSTSEFANACSVLTIHNMAFQGQFWHWDMLLTGLDWKYFNWRQFEFFEKLNLLKGGIVFADAITTVSPTYAREIQTPEFGAGLDDVLRERRDRLTGILNGVDVDVWNPATDPALPRNYTAETVAEGKAACKAALQKQMGLSQRPDVPLFGMISRMTSQKGLDLLAECADDLLKLDAQFAFLGTGEERFERWLNDLARRRPDRVAATIGFDEELAHRIEAGADVYLMPSRFEPCGLNQMYSMRYGAVPLVRAVGGLGDSITDVKPETLAAGTATGFCFDESTPQALAAQVERAVNTYADKSTWRKIVANGMRRDVSWNNSAAAYEAVYRQAANSRVPA